MSLKTNYLLSILCFSLAFLLMPLTVQAYEINNYTWDMTSFGVDYGSWDNVDELNWGVGFQPNTVIKQILNASGDVEDGLAFEESVFLNLDSYIPESGSGGSIGTLIPNNQRIVFVNQDLQGTISEVTGSLAGGDAEWTYNFTPGVGDIGFYLMSESQFTDLGNNWDKDGYQGGDATIFNNKLLNLEIQPGSEGTTVQFDGSSFTSQGSFNVPFQVTWAMPGIFTDNDTGDDFSDLADDELLFSTQTGEPALNDPSFFDANGNEIDLANLSDAEYFLVDGNTADKYNVSAVPEPTTLLLFGTGLLGLAAFGRKKFMRR